MQRYVIGIDLGTTNSCLAYIDTHHPAKSIQILPIPQITSAGYLNTLPTLPSFCYLAEEGEFPKEFLKLPWRNGVQVSSFFVGESARFQGSKVPTRLVQSAKSWLCHAGVNRKEAILPFEGSHANRKISPLEATIRYLSHLKEAWNHAMTQGDPDREFSQQEVVVTVPASFDEVARGLTIEAAKAAGFGSFTLLEEPQAAFYSWISHHEKDWEKIFRPGERILVCDVGGGTTDFSLIEVTEFEKGKGFQRMAVGEHLLLGGDNIDRAIAQFLEEKFKVAGYPEIDNEKRLKLQYEARAAKEKLLAPKVASNEFYSITLQGSGASVVRGSFSTMLSRQELEEFLLKGFFSFFEWNEALQLQKRRGMRTMGLPYEDEPSITKQLARFLKESSNKRETIQPDYLLFNGGTMRPPIFQEAIFQSLCKWFPQKSLQLLHSFDLDLAVARGAAYYGKARRGEGVKIGGGSARGYYLEVDLEGKEKKALTLLPRGSEEGSFYEAPQSFLLMPNTPVAFHLYSSHVRLHDQSGDWVSIDPAELHLLPPIHTILRYGKKTQLESSKEPIPVHLKIHISPLGTLELALQAVQTSHEWNLEFQLRSVTGQEDYLKTMEKRSLDETLESKDLEEAKKVIEKFFSGEKEKIGLMDQLENVIGKSRKEWSSQLLRELWSSLLLYQQRPGYSPEKEVRWWNLAGFLLRPGYGYPLDDFRMKELWKVILSTLKASLALDTEIQCAICYRRVAGGLNKGQQIQLATPWISTLFSERGIIEVRGKREEALYVERIRALGSFERLESKMKLKLGQALVQRIVSEKAIQADFWALSRIGARHLFYGSIVDVTPKEAAEHWVKALLKLKPTQKLAFLLGQLARKTIHPELNLSKEIIGAVLEAYRETSFFERLRALLQEETVLTEEEQEQVFGDLLPFGLRLVESGHWVGSSDTSPRMTAT